jgi:hypothetical protein
MIFCGPLGAIPTFAVHASASLKAHRSHLSRAIDALALQIGRIAPFSPQPFPLSGISVHHHSPSAIA